MDEVLRLPVDKALVILRGQKVLMVDKFDYSNHPESKKLKPAKASAYIPAWTKEVATPPAEPARPRHTPKKRPEPGQKPTVPKAPKAPKPAPLIPDDDDIMISDRDSIIPK